MAHKKEKRIVDLYEILSWVIDISGKYLPNDFDTLYFEIKENIGTKKINKKEILNAIKKNKYYNIVGTVPCCLYHTIENIDPNIVLTVNKEIK